MGQFVENVVAGFGSFFQYFRLSLGHNLRKTVSLPISKEHQKEAYLAVT